MLLLNPPYTRRCVPSQADLDKNGYAIYLFGRLEIIRRKGLFSLLSNVSLKANLQVCFQQLWSSLPNLKKNILHGHKLYGFLHHLVDF